MTSLMRIILVSSVLALPLGGCASVSDSLDPTEWFSGDFSTPRKSCRAIARRCSPKACRACRRAFRLIWSRAISSRLWRMDTPSPIPRAAARRHGRRLLAGLRPELTRPGPTRRARPRPRLMSISRRRAKRPNQNPSRSRRPPSGSRLRKSSSQALPRLVALPLSRDRLSNRSGRSRRAAVAACNGPTRQRTQRR